MPSRFLVVVSFARSLLRWVARREVAWLAGRHRRGASNRWIARRLGASRLREGRYDEADALLARGIAAFPRDARLRILYATSAHNSWRYEIAFARWVEAARVAPGKPICHHSQVANLRESGRLHEANAAMEATLARFPAEIGTIVEAARLAECWGDSARAHGLWTRAVATRRPHPDWHRGLIQSLILLGCFDDAGVAIRNARAHHPDHEGLYAMEGLLASGREDWPRALSFWSEYRRRYPDSRTGWEQHGHALEAIQTLTVIDEAPPAPADRAPPRVERVEDQANRALLLRFESLGDNCEFGSVQRRFGAEPLGLLRWNHVTVDNLIDASRHGFDGMGDETEMELSVLGNGEYFLRHRRWDLGMHTFLFKGQTDEALLFPKMCRRVAFLKRKLLDDLAAAEKIFVYRSPGLTEVERTDLLAALRRHGPVTLLVAQPTGTPGEIVQDVPGLYRGGVGRLGVTAGGAWDIAFDDWLAICRKTASAVDAGRAAMRLAG